MWNKRIFISSTGRTGTQFFAKYMHEMIRDSVSLHEPGTPWFSKPKQLLGQVKEYGIYHLSVGQGKNTHSMYKLSRDYIAGEISREDACKNIIAINEQVDRLYPADVTVYSSGHIYGLMELLDSVYKNSRFVFIIRDPREWITSALNKIEYSLYGPIEIFYRKISLQPSCYEDDPYLQEWNHFSKFEKYCWFYEKLNTHVMKEMQGKENFRVFRYEDLFLGEDKVEHFGGLLEFATEFQDGSIPHQYCPETISNKVDSKKNSSTWESWTPEQVKIMHRHCGALMQEYGYGQENMWQDKLL
ncbi:MAG: hypothetical protein R3Y67_03355 [Eubacteriales bacterium]